MNTRNLPIFACVLLSIILLSSCAGYQLAADQPNILGDGTKTLKIKEVDYPTLDPWLSHSIRSVLRDEINARHLAKWVDSGHADYEIAIKVTQFTSREWMRSKEDYTILYDATITLEATLYDGKTNKKIWSSNPISYNDRLDSPGQKKTSERIIVEVMRRLSDKLQNTF